MNIIIEFRIFKLVLVPNFSLDWHLWLFWLDLPKKGFSGLKQKKWTSHIFYIILHIQIGLVWNFNSNWQFWVFEPNLPKKVFPVKNWNVNIITDFRIFKLVLVPNFSLNWHFWVFWLDLPKMVFRSKTEKVNITYFLHNSAYSNWSSVKFQLKLTILLF